MDMDAFAARVALVGPLLLQALAMILLGVIVALRDGSITPDVVYGLLAIMLGNVAGATVIGYKHGGAGISSPPAPSPTPTGPVVTAPPASPAPASPMP